MPPKAAEAVKVVVRCRPMNGRERDKNCKGVVKMLLDRGEVYITNPNARAGEKPKSFTFDAVYDWNAEQISIYRETAAPIVKSVIEGFNGTIFAYGQTGAGKTWTMEGVREPRELQGIIPNSFEDIFDKIVLSEGTQFLVRASYLEIYQEEIRDLLATGKEKLALKERPNQGVYVQGLSSFVVKGFKEIDHVMNVGSKNRVVGATLMNAGSSRSHAIFTITIEASETIEGQDEPRLRMGKLNLVDLAGSERQSKTGATGDRLKEGAKINLSLSALGNVIKALVDGKSKHVPYRDSKLTRLLMDSLGGNTKTVMVANMSPADDNYEEGMSTLRYADRAKQIKNKPKINEDPKDAMLREYQEEILRLKEMIMAKAAAGEGGAGGPIDGNPIDGNPQLTVDGGMEISPELIEEMKIKTEAEISEILKERGYHANEIQEMSHKIHEASRRKRAEQKAAAKMAKKLKMMEEKLLGGQDHLIDLNRKQEAIIRQKQIKLEMKRAKELRLQREVKEAEKQKQLMEQKYTDLETERKIKTKKLRRFIKKWKLTDQEIKDIQDEFEQEKEDLLESIRELSNEYKLKYLIVNNFVPADEVRKIEARAYWDEEKEEWLLRPRVFTSVVEKNKVKRPLSAHPGNVRPMSAFAAKSAKSSAASAQLQMMDKSYRFKASNILHLDLELPERRTVDYGGVSEEHEATLALRSALKEEEDEQDISVSASENFPNVFLNEPSELSALDMFTKQQHQNQNQHQHDDDDDINNNNNNNNNIDNNNNNRKGKMLNKVINSDRRRERSRSMPPKQINSNADENSDLFPKSRGLVSRSRF